MKLSENGAALIKAFESCLAPHKTRKGYYVPYICPAGVLTIGWGHTNHHEPKFDQKAVWSQKQCDEVFIADMAIFEAHVSRLAKVKLTQSQFDALVSWAYNTGAPSTSQVWKAVNSGSFIEVPALLARWNKGGGKVLNGLVRRRKAEGLLWQGKVKEALNLAGGQAHITTGRATTTPTPTALETAKTNQGAVSALSVGVLIATAPLTAMSSLNAETWVAIGVAAAALISVSGFMIYRNWKKQKGGDGYA